MKNVALHNLGCKVNSYEIDVMQQMLQEKGYKIVPFDEMADIYIINTCTVTNIADRKSRQMLHRARTMNPDAVVIAVGCYVQTGKEDVLKDASIDLAIGNNKKHELVSIIEKFLEEREKTLSDTTVIDINQTNEYEEMTLKQTAEHTRAYIKIQDGCNQFCSYCIIPFARGRVRSRKLEDIEREVSGIVKAGYQEIVLTGIHLSSYGNDFHKGVSTKPEDHDFTDPAVYTETNHKAQPLELIDVIERLQDIEGLKRIRLGSLEPRVVTKEFAERLQKLSKVCPHFHLSLQSGCDNTLKRMNRKYTTAEYYNSVKILREYFDNPAITTDVIVGFPQETEEEFLVTKDFLEKVQFFEMHIFKYSRRAGTVAAKMEGQIPDQVKALRSNSLLELEKEMSRAYRGSYIGRDVEVLFEETKKIGDAYYEIGHTDRYVKVAKKSPTPLSNRIISGRITGFLNDEILFME